MEKLGKSNGRREGLEGKNKGDGLEFRGGVYDGGKVGGTRAWLGRALWGEALLAAGKQRSPHSEGCQWLLMFGGEVRGWRCTWLDWREERAWLGQAMWSEALLGSCWEAKEPAG